MGCPRVSSGLVECQKQFSNGVIFSAAEHIVLPQNSWVWCYGFLLWFALNSAQHIFPPLIILIPGHSAQREGLIALQPRPAMGPVPAQDPIHNWTSSVQFGLWVRAILTRMEDAVSRTQRDLVGIVRYGRYNSPFALKEMFWRLQTIELLKSFLIRWILNLQKVPISYFLERRVSFQVFQHTCHFLFIWFD